VAFYREPQPVSSILFNVPASRAAADLVEQHTGVAHESSQVLAMRDSHREFAERDGVLQSQRGHF
jgi:hypothetical protein